MKFFKAIFLFSAKKAATLSVICYVFKFHILYISVKEEAKKLIQSLFTICRKIANNDNKYNYF